MNGNNLGFSKNTFGGQGSTQIAGIGGRTVNMGTEGGRRSVEEVRQNQMQANSSSGFIVDSTTNFNEKSKFVVDTTQDYSEKSYSTGVDTSIGNQQTQMGQEKNLPSAYKSQYESLGKNNMNQSNNEPLKPSYQEYNSEDEGSYVNPVRSSGMTGAFNNQYTQSNMNTNSSYSQQGSFNGQQNQNDFNRSRLESMRHTGIGNNNPFNRGF